MNTHNNLYDSSNRINRGLYLIIVNDKKFYDNPKNPDYLTVPNGAVKIGKSLNLDSINKRYTRHSKRNIESHTLIRLRDRDDIDILEKLIHHHFNEYRLKNINNRKVEWMEPIPIQKIIKEVNIIFNKYFDILNFNK